MKVTPDILCVQREQICFRRLHSHILTRGLHRSVYILQVIKRINIRHIPRVQNVI